MSGPVSDAYDVRGGVRVLRSAVVIPLRQRGGRWEVLMTEAEVVNWLRSSLREQRLVPMRYGGEWKLPGGNIEGDETPRAAAVREATEEVLAFTSQRRVPEGAVLRGFTVRQTRPIRSKSNIIYYYVALEEENPWLLDLDLDEANAGLHRRRAAFTSVLMSGAYDSMPPGEKETLAPEVHRIAWLPIADATASSFSTVQPGKWAGAFQQREYKRWGLRRTRDPMVLTGIVLQDLAAHTTPAALSAQLLSDDAMTAAARSAQWVFDGMTQADVDMMMHAKSADAKL